MPSSTRPAADPSNSARGSKRAVSDSDSASHDPKKARTVSSSRHDSNKRRKGKKRKTPAVTTADPKDDVALVPLTARNDSVRTDTNPSPLHTPSSQHQPPADNASEPRHPNDMSPLPSSSLEGKVAKLEAELKSKNDLIASHQALLNQVQQATTCQVCLDLMYKPYALAPCGHLACHACLVNWFTAPPPDNRQVPPAITRRKTCPHCRAVVRERPVEVWGVKSVAQAIGKSGLLPNQLPVPVDTPDSLSAHIDPWKDIFPKQDVTSHGHVFPWFFPDADIDDDDAQIADVDPRDEDVGIPDMEDGGIYRCVDCLHEIWDGACTGCGRLYPGRRPVWDHEEYEEYEDNAMGWLEDQMGAEVVDVADDPGWMGLEDGEADDDGDDWDDWGPWRRLLPFPPHLFLESGDEGYESSFIDDDDDRAGIADYFDAPRIYEIGDGDDDEGGSDSPRRRWTGRGRVVSSDDDADGPEDGADLTRQPISLEGECESDCEW